MGEGVYREVLKNPLVNCRVYAPVGAHRDLLAYLVRRLLENGAHSSFVHQMADESVGMQELLISPLRLEPHPSLPLPADLFGVHTGARKNSTGLDLTVPAMREPLLAALSVVVPVVPEFDVENIGLALMNRAGAAIKSGARWMYPSAPPSCAKPPTPCWRKPPCSVRSSSKKRTRPGAMQWLKCAKRSTSCATTPMRPSASCSPC
jgi:hypothetical protein